MLSALPPLTALSLKSLSLEDADGLATAAPKRKAPSSSSSSSGHYGLSNDSSFAVRLVVLSRLMRARDESILETAARGAIGAGVLHGLQGSVLRVAVSVGGADASLSAAQIATLFNMSASTVATQRLYDGGLSLPSKLPWRNAKALLSALLSALSGALATEAGAQVTALLLQSPPPQSLDQAAIAAISKLVVTVEAAMASRLSSGDAASSSSSVRSSSPTAPASLPSAMGPPQSSVPPVPPAPSAVAVEAFSIAPALSFVATIQRLVEAQLARPLEPSERDVLATAVEEGLSVLQPGGAEARRQLLAGPVLSALAATGAAQLWGCCLESTEGGIESVAALAGELVSCCSAIAAATFTSAIGI